MCVSVYVCVYVCECVTHVSVHVCMCERESTGLTVPIDLNGSRLYLHDVKRGLAPPTTDGLQWTEQGLSVDKPVPNLFG